MTVRIYIFEFPARCKDLEANLNSEHNHISANVLKLKNVRLRSYCFSILSK